MQPQTELATRGAADPFPDHDQAALKREIERIGAKTALDFGPGKTTRIMLAAGVERIVSCEHIDQWLEVAREDFENNPRVTILKYHDEVPCGVDGLQDGQRFDIALVDSPKGFSDAVRKQHKGYETYSRLNTLLKAMQHADVCLLHDCVRDAELASLRYLFCKGYGIQLIPGTMLARITAKLR